MTCRRKPIHLSTVSGLFEVNAIKEEISLVIDQLLRDRRTCHVPPNFYLMSDRAPGVGYAPAANDSHWQAPAARRRAAELSKRSESYLSVFFRTYAKRCAKSAWDLLNGVKFRAVDKRLRAALAACFFGFFSLFPSDTHSANLSTTP